MIKKLRLISKNVIILLIGFIFQNCEDDDKTGQLTIIDGRVADYYSNVGIPDVMMLFINEESNTDPMVFQHLYYDTIYTDSSGQYHYEFVNDTMRTYTIMPRPSEQYFSTTNESRIKEGKVNTCNFLFKHYRILKLHVVNQQKKWTRISISNAPIRSQINQTYVLRGIDTDTLLDFKIIPEYINMLNISLTIGDKSPPDEYKHERLTVLTSSNCDTIMTYNY